MKKSLFIMMAACAIGFTSCGNKSQQAVPVDDEVVAEAPAIDVEAIFNEATAQLTEQIEANDASKLQQAIEAVQAKVKEILAQNPEAAQEYVQKIQDFLKENAEKIKAVAGDNAAIQAAFSALTEAPAESIISGLKSTLDTAGEAVEGAADAAGNAVEGAADAAQEAVEGAVEDAKDAAKEKAGEAVDAAAQKAKDAMGL
jgi:phage-related protein